ncbi:MAG: hypothetical protein Q8K85_03360 [Hyphomicrobium sp.]|nr:hypothetical protein [Hyphomicrobium sp.]
MTLCSLLYILANLVIAFTLGCMLQSAWEKSATGFRLAVSLLAAMAVGAMFFGVELLTATGRADLLELSESAVVELAKSVMLAVVLVMMRLRQREMGQDKHSKQRCAPDGAQHA